MMIDEQVKLSQAREAEDLAGWDKVIEREHRWITPRLV